MVTVLRHRLHLERGSDCRGALPHVVVADHPLVARVLEAHTRENFGGASDFDDLCLDYLVLLSQAPELWVRWVALQVCRGLEQERAARVALGGVRMGPVWKSNFGRPTPPTR